MKTLKQIKNPKYFRATCFTATSSFEVCVDGPRRITLVRTRDSRGFNPCKTPQFFFRDMVLPPTDLEEFLWETLFSLDRSAAVATLRHVVAEARATAVYNTLDQFERVALAARRELDV